MNGKKIEEVEDTHWFEKFSSILEQNIRGVQLGLYTVAFTGLAIALRSVRPFKKFTNPKDIPPAFFHKHITLSGKVLRIDFNPKPLLVVDHLPIIGHKFRSEGSGLPVNIESIDVSGNGVSWLQAIVVGKHIDFTLLVLQPSCVSCIVTHKNKNVGNSLVSLGFASASPFNIDLESDALYKKYYQSLLKDEGRAERNGAGMWWERPPTLKTRLLSFILSKLPTLRLKT